MIITRDGMTIELTDAEIEEAYRIREKEYLQMDIRSRAKDIFGEDYEISDEEMPYFAERTRNCLDKCDGYYDYYWGCVDSALEQSRDGKI